MFFLFPLITLLLVSACTQDDIPSHSTISNIVEKEHINTIQSTGDIHLITGVDGIIRNATASVETGYYELLPREDGAFNISYTDYQTATRVYLCNRPNANTAIPHVQAGCLQMIAQVVPDFLRMEINSMCNGKGQALKSDIRKQ